ncbi:MAG: PIG-L family deacetylase [Acidobacteriota bacterium]
MHLNPPGEPGSVHAERVLVLAPHYDDEVLGCGVLLSLLTRAGARVDVAFLTDGGGGVEGAPEGDSPESYAATRRAEAERAGAVLGLESLHFFDLPDGRLESERAELARRLDELLVPEVDLVLSPSPLESTPDHRAAFAALHDVLHQDRGTLASGLSVLAYEINHPLYPNLLIDATGELETLETAMAEYASQQSRHDYLSAALGLRHYRTHTLGPEIEAAEGYFRLELADFQTRSYAQLVAHMGGLPETQSVSDGPLVSVVVRTKDRPDLLAEALESVAASFYRNLEVLVVNDGGAPPSTPENYPLPIDTVDLQPGRGRAGAAQAGVDAARGEYVAFLDDDDLVYPEHYATLVAALGAGVRVVYSDAAVVAYELGDGWREVSRRIPYSRDHDADLLRLENYIPLHTLLVERALCREVGAFDDSFDSFEDWDWLLRLSELTAFHHLPLVTCEYRHFLGSGHHALAADVKSHGQRAAAKARVLAKHAANLTPARLAAASSVLRDEGVRALEARDAARRDERNARQELEQLRGRFERIHGEVGTLRQERERLLDELSTSQQELARLFAEEKVLRASASELQEHLARTYAEIERLGGLIDAMESSRAFKLQQLLGRKG